MTRPNPATEQARIRKWILLVLSESTGWTAGPYYGAIPEESFFGQAKVQGWTAKKMEKAIERLVDEGAAVSTVVDLGSEQRYKGKRHPRFIPALRMP